MAIRLGDVFPNFKAQTTIGEIDFHEWVGDSWAILFSHPADFTPVCTTELGRAANYVPKFNERGVKLIALSCDSVESHKGWIQDIKSYSKLPNQEFPYPIIADPTRDLATLFGMLDPDEKDAAGLPLTCRAAFFIGPEKKLKASILYPATTGRSFDEILRVVDSLQLTITHKVATPVDWKPGSQCMVLPTLTDADVQKLFPQGIDQIDVPSKEISSYRSAQQQLKCRCA
jgi:1-Cys peroxiredoxin 6